MTASLNMNLFAYTLSKKGTKALGTLSKGVIIYHPEQA